jgi:hypothetical protein
VRSDEPGPDGRLMSALGRARAWLWQDRLHGGWVRVGHGCHCNRPTLENIERAGFSITEIEHDRLRRAPPIVRPLIAGVALA